MAVSIEDYGAVPDWDGRRGTDNSAAIQKAIASGARTIYVPPKHFRIAETIVLGDGQQLIGEKGALYISTRAQNQSLLALKSSHGAMAAICNAPGTRGQGVHAITLEIDDPTHVGVQFSGSYGNAIANLTLFGVFDVGITLHDSYVCKVSDVVACGCRVRRAVIYIGSSNAVSIAKLHTSALPYDSSTCMRAIAIYGGGRGYTIESPVLQGATIGLHVHPGILSLQARDIYTENTVCAVRLGEGNEGPHAVTLQGLFSMPYSDHPQASAAGPMVWYEAGHAVRIEPSRFDSAPNAASRRGPWPILLGPNSGSLTLDPQSGFQTPDDRKLLFQTDPSSPPPTAVTWGGSHLTNIAPTTILNGVSKILTSSMPNPKQIVV